jgi:hypothetical protein
MSQLSKYGLHGADDDCWLAMVEELEQTTKEIIGKTIEKSRARNWENNPKFNASLVGEVQKLTLH